MAFRSGEKNVAYRQEVEPGLQWRRSERVTPAATWASPTASSAASAAAPRPRTSSTPPSPTTTSSTTPPAAVWVKTEPLSQSQPKSVLRFPQSVDDNVSARVKQEDGVGPTGPGDFWSAPTSLSYDDYYSEIRMRDVMGIHNMIRMQCKAWVEEFRVSPLICGLAGSIWLRLVALSGVFGDSWADESIYESESQKQGTMK
ncbi:hypothetical protein Acr_13g0015530 [Actinidia rufa]|uniref:Uncharacterized protein n=1 Tax=Actinidia rufa TaxID=165716 RepID=A0A7J0FNJ4_9ERIC|nr:hypothetical protein Acr_13g0015530 [Actinidia rufa]